MPAYIFTTPDGVHFRNTDKPYSVTLLDAAFQPASARFPAAVEDFDCAASLATNRFAMGFWSKPDLTLYDLRSGDELATFPFRKIAPMAGFDADGRRLLFQSGSQVVLLDVTTSVAVPIRGVRALECLIRLRDRNEVLVPSQRKGELLRISLTTGDVVALPLPIDATFFDIQRSPTSPHLILIDRKKGVHCLDLAEWRLAWSVSLKKLLGSDHLGVGQYSGDGTLFGGFVAGRTTNYTIVLDAHTGEQTGRLRTIADECLPFRGTRVRDQATKNNSLRVETLDLATGKCEIVTLDAAAK